MQTQKKVQSLLAVTMVLLMALMVPMAGQAATTQATVVFTPGPLELTSAPALDFGSHAIDGVTDTFSHPASPNPTLVVTDSTGNGAGWKVTAWLSQFEKSDVAGTQTLTGAYIQFQEGVCSVGGDTTAADAPYVGTANSTNQSKLISGDSTTPVRVFTAETDKGRGRWQSDWATLGNITLFVPTSVQVIGTHQATLTWDLASTPS